MCTMSLFRSQSPVRRHDVTDQIVREIVAKCKKMPKKMFRLLDLYVDKEKKYYTCTSREGKEKKYKTS